MTYAAESRRHPRTSTTAHPPTLARPIDSNNDVDALANFDQYRAHDSLRALYHEGKVFSTASGSTSCTWRRSSTRHS